MRRAVCLLLGLMLLCSGLGAVPAVAQPAVPNVTGISPNFTLASTPGEIITITGTGFTGVTEVDFGTTHSTILASGSTTLQVVAPSAAVGTVDIRVTTPAGTSPITPNDQFSFVGNPPPPILTGISPSSGSTAGGTVVTITGSYFTFTTTVDFGGTPANNLVVNSDSSLTVTAPPGVAGTVDVTVSNVTATTATTPADQFLYITPPAPAIASISPTTGPAPGGTIVAIIGANFTSTTQVNFGGTPATSFTVIDDSHLSATAPSGSGAVDVQVTTYGGTTPPIPDDVFTYDPAVTGVSPSIGATAGGTIVTITGANFAGAIGVGFGGTPATSFTIVSPSQITAVSPPGPIGTVDVVVITPTVTSPISPADHFTLKDLPAITAVGPNNGPVGGGTSVIIAGSGFTSATAVNFGAAAAASFAVKSDTQILAVTPAGAGMVDVSVITPNGTSTPVVADQFAYGAAPSVTAISPSSGPAAGGTAIIITGTGFTNAAAVKFGSAAAESFLIKSDTQISAASAPGTGTVDVTVTTATGTSATSAADRFTYATAPNVTAISPGTGPAVGDTGIVITGTGFIGATAVKFGAVAAQSFAVKSDTQITATSPAGTGTVDVTVTTATGTSATGAADQFSYGGAPSVTSISPGSGPAVGDTGIVITGTGFIGATTVKFGAVPAQSFAVKSDTQITATSPAGTGTGTVDVTVTTAKGTSATSAADQFTFVSAPSVTAISPALGPITGGTTVTLTGTGFTGATAVTFGGTSAGFTVVSATAITVTAPAGSAGTYDIQVTTPAGISARTATDQFTLVPAPTVTGISPAGGLVAGGTSVTIAGTNFASASAVRFGKIAAASFTVVSSTQITATTPAGTVGVVDVTVTAPGGTSVTSPADQYTYGSTPAVSAVSPLDGPTIGGNTVTIAGTNLTGATAVKFGATLATNLVVVSATQLTVTAPAGPAGIVDVTVTTPIGASATDAADGYTYVASPAVSAIAPTSGSTAGGTSVTITGSGLTGATGVKFGTAAASFTVNSATQITATAPAGTVGSVDITVTTAGGTSAASAADQFSYVAAPTVAALSPVSGPIAGGNAVTITGTNLTGATAVKFGTASAGFTVGSATQITATAPAGSAGAVDVTVTTPNGTSAASPADQYTYGSGPTVSAVSPSSGPTNGGNTVTITGANLSGATAVKFGNAPASFTIAGATQITAIAPPGSGTVDVTVTTPDGTSAASAADRFTYTAQPLVTAISPASGATSGGTIVTITGSNLSAATSVRFGAVAAPSFTIASASEIAATTPAGVAGTVDVTVTTADGISAVSAADRFTYTTGTGGQVYAYQSTLGVTGVAKPDNAHLGSPIAGAVDSANSHLFVADAGNHRVQVFDTTSLAVVATLCTTGVAGSDNAHLNGPQGVGIDPATGHVLVADTGNDRIQIFDAKSLAYIATLGADNSPGVDNGHFDHPASVHSSQATRELYVADAGNHRVQIFNADTFAYLATLGVSGVAGTDTAHLNAPMDAEFNPSANQIMVADSGNGRVQLFDAASLVYAATLGGAAPGKDDNDYLGTPVTAAFDPTTDLVLIADGGADDRVQVFDAMTYGYVLTLGTTGSSGTGNGQFAGPSGIAVDPTQARLFIGDRQNDRVQAFSIAPPVNFAAVLPGSRSVQLGGSATVFASMINAGATPLRNCRVALPVTAPSGLTLSYQTANPATNALTGTADTPATIAGNDGVQSFLLTFQGTDAFSATAMPLDFGCDGVAPAAIVTGVDTVDLTLAPGPVADIIALAATPTGNGVVEIPSGGAGAFSIATTNAGAGSPVAVSVDTGTASLPLSATICPSSPATGQCLATPAGAVLVNAAAGAASTFSVFLTASGPIALDPAHSRIFVRFKDTDGTLHGSTSVAVEAE